MKRPVMIYDGDCHFCTRWIERWRSITGDVVDYVPSQKFDDAGIPAEAFARSVQFLDRDGRRHERAQAVFLALAAGGSWAGRALAGCHRRVPGFGAASDGLYDAVARNRSLFSWLTRVLWGGDVKPPTYGVSTMLFLRALGLIYLVAFVSFGVQSAGLLGRNGILPVADVLPRVAEAFGSESWRIWPTLVWLGPPDFMMSLLTWAGAGCALLVLLGMLQPVALALAWGAYLSLVVVGQDFYSFQWDSLLLETGLLAIFIAPWTWTPRVVLRPPSAFAHFLLIWLLFRLIFASGVVKLSSGDPVWANLTAPEYHYFTQPIPNAGAWLLAQAPAWFQRVSCGAMFFVELVLPFFVFMPRRPRLVACGGFLGLQILIDATGNYGFFNILAAALALLLIDDAVWPRMPRSAKSVAVPWRRWILGPLGVAYLLLSLVPLAGAFRTMPAVLRPLLAPYGWVAPFRSINGYGLFAVMTTERPEIRVEGSEDGFTWRAYTFRFKPGPLDRMPPFVAPCMPRLDWQMWFAALGDVRQSPWFLNFMVRLFEAEPDVLRLLENDPFEGKPPRYLRARLDDYRFTDPAALRRDGVWWRRTEAGTYLPEIRAEQLR